MEEREWIILNYTLPKEPSRIRVSIWRKLKKRGSISIGQSMWVLPFSKEQSDFFEKIADEIQKNEGEAYLMKSSFLSNENSESIIQAFHRARDEEYQELLEQCEDFFREIEKEIKRENFTFAEYEENEYEYNKLMEWFTDISERDFFAAQGKADSEQKMEQCRELLEDFGKKVYDRNKEI